MDRGMLGSGTFDVPYASDSEAKADITGDPISLLPVGLVVPLSLDDAIEPGQHRQHVGMLDLRKSMNS
jgi:hypothetical protein